MTWVEDMPVYLGVPIRCIFDEAMQYAPLTVSRLNGQTDVYAVRDASGGLTGLRAATAEEFAQNTAANYLAGAPAPTAPRPPPGRARRSRFLPLASTPTPPTACAWKRPALLPRCDRALFRGRGRGAGSDMLLLGRGGRARRARRNGAIAALRPSTRAEFEQKTQDGWEELRADYAAPEDANAAYNWNGRMNFHRERHGSRLSLRTLRPWHVRWAALLRRGGRALLPRRGAGRGSVFPSSHRHARPARRARRNGELTGLRVATAEETAAIAGHLYEDEASPQQGGPLGSVEAAEDWY